MTSTATRSRRAEGPQRAQGRRRGLGSVLPMLLVLAGILVLLYPVLATQYNNVRQREFADRYNTDVQQIAPDRREDVLEAARRYNEGLSGVPILDPYLLKVSADPGSEQFKAYDAQLSEAEVMARVRVHTAEIDLPVRHGTSDDAISTGAGHLYGTSLPVGGPSTHSVLTSHTGMANATLFDHLTSVREGDLMFIDVMGETLAYKVDQIKVVLPTEIEDLHTFEGKDYLTLFTCTPYAVNTHRLLVRGERVPYTPEIAEQFSPERESPIKMEPWMWGLVAAAVVGVLFVVFMLWRERRRKARARVATPAVRPDEDDWSPLPLRALVDDSDWGAHRVLDEEPTTPEGPGSRSSDDRPGRDWSQDD